MNAVQHSLHFTNHIKVVEFDKKTDYFCLSMRASLTYLQLS